MRRVLGNSRRGGCDAGTTMVEVVVSAALLAVFTVATVAVVTSGTATSADNRARVGASALAQRELEYSSQIVTTKGSLALRNLGVNGTEQNPNLTPELTADSAGASGESAEYKFALDGVRYKVVRRAELWPASEGSACHDIDQVGAQPIFGTEVTVTVTWLGMGTTTKPHVAKQVFPPGRDETLLQDPEGAVIAVVVKGVGGPNGTLRQGVKVEVNGPGAPGTVKMTNQKGCAVVEVKPAEGGSDYEVRLLGGPAGTWIDHKGEENPVQVVPALEREGSVTLPFDYDWAASVSVEVVDAPASIGSVDLVPAAGSASLVSQLIDASGKAVFDKVFPGFYFVTVGDQEPTPVELLPGKHRDITITVS